MLNARARNASSGPARNSLPHGAGKCPIINLKLIGSSPFNSNNNIADNTPIKATTKQVTRSGKTALLLPANFLTGISGVIIAVSIARNIEMNGILNAKLFIIVTPLHPSVSS